MLTVRRKDEIFEKDGGWFRARWHFSFDEYRDPEQDGVGALRVFNDDQIVGGAAWPMHPHRDVESLTYIARGRFEHADSLGNGGQLHEGAAQVMDFGHEGALHSERNASEDDPVRFIQFWILPSDPELRSGVQQRQYTAQDRRNRWLQIMGPVGEEGLDLSQNARVFVAQLPAGRSLDHVLAPGRGAYLYLIEGAGVFDDEEDVFAGDAAKVTGAHELTVEATEDAELILIDVPLDFQPVGVWATPNS
ncbi:pirin family protein [Natronosporangium hydrolyticum]|uniref:Pirin family protein n=1 Tax=Natronosporangium hydrolyticum TaxID=2811111 RepID=A0A895YH91_9ACTN|nr:pirin family protein [Natronosporangium hydrolyticum]QSB15425.1 pirin family protein [Natronosporangium hydrolyticum]